MYRMAYPISIPLHTPAYLMASEYLSAVHMGSKGEVYVLSATW